MHPALVALIFVAKYGSAAVVGEVARDLYRGAKEGTLQQQVKNRVDRTKEYWHNILSKRRSENELDKN